ncbi:MAG TPA: citrate synthase family protein [Aggregatilineales bacterium]|nr:citrate synthase family protein [Aggregatilineales bacterium]
MPPKRYLTAKDAASALGISAATLYAYVSRGLIRSEAVGDNHRARRYLAEDVEKLVARKEQRQDPTKVARDALSWGVPVLESALTLITGTTLYYRGRDACQLAQMYTLEQVAALLWTESPDAAAVLFERPGAFEILPVQTESPVQAMQIALAISAGRDLSAYNMAPESVARTGASILWLLTGTLTGMPVTAPTIAEALAKAWRVESVRLLDAALILCADHELNASSFAARVIASTGANPYAVVTGGLAALQGSRHGGNTRRVSAFLREVGQTGDIRAAIRGYLQRGESVPGFGHRLYPSGDPRAALLLRLAAENNTEAAYLALMTEIIREVQQATSQAPNLDMALAVLEGMLHLPPDSALALFGLGRTVGWIGHAIEQYATQQLIRPRATYVGKLPVD